PWNAMRDLRANQRMGVFATESGFGSGATDIDVADNPLLADTGLQWGYGSPDGPKKRVLFNDLFRAVHDAFGHGLEGAGFRAQGEENAWQAHVRLFTGSAVGAITSETRGQNSWLNFGPYGETNRTAKVEDTVFADQKTGLMPEWTWSEGIVDNAPVADVLEQSVAPGFYSALSRGVEAISAKAMPAQGWKDQIKGMVNKGQAKSEEVEWSGVNDWLDLQEGKVTKEAVVAYLEQGGVKVEEVVLGVSTLKPFTTAEVDGGWVVLDNNQTAFPRGRITEGPFDEEWEANNARDMLNEDLENGDYRDWSASGVASAPKYGQYTLPGGENYREVLLTLP
ncbi:MAG: hypothetical protein ACK5QX_08940, partial [bacterium]